MNSKRREGEGEVAFFIRNVLMASTAAMTAEVATIPLDTAKVRLQLQKVVPGETPRYNGLLGTMKVMAAEEGTLSLWNGLTPGLQRQFVFAGLRIGMYVPIRNMICGPLKEGENPTLLQKIMAGMTTGAIAITVANPTDVVKIRMQAQGQLPVDQRVYKNSIHCYKHTVANQGIGGLWAGWGPNVIRNSVINAAEIASYDQFKQIAMQNLGFKDGTHTHIMCAFSAGFVATIVGSPVDVLKTRMMNASKGQSANPITVCRDVLANEGAAAFYKGFFANFMRLGCWNVCMFVTLEQIKSMFA